MSSSSKREENEEKLLQSSRRGDLDTVLVSINKLTMHVFVVYKIIGMASSDFIITYHFLIDLNHLRFIWKKSHL